MQKRNSSKVKKALGIIGSFLVILIMIMFFEGQLRFWGIFGFIIILGGIALFRLLKSDFFMVGLRNIESTIWGKPLDKSMWEKGEMKQTKVEMTFRGKKMSLKNLIPKNKALTNKHLSATFFAFTIMFFFIFIANRYTLNIIMAIVMLQFSLYFKTADLVRQNYDKLLEILERK